MFYKSLKKHVLCLFYGFYCYVLWFFICKLMFFNIYGVNATVAEAYGIDASLFYVSVGSAGGGGECPHLNTVHTAVRSVVIV